MDRLWAMQVFAKVVEVGSFSGAARQLDLANASVTSCIRNLEEHLGVTLLQRTTRHVHVTDEGGAYYERCKAILSQVDEAEGAVRHTSQGLRGTLRIETPFAMGHSVLTPLLVELAQLNPELCITTMLTNQIDNLVERGTDVALRMDEVEAADLIARPVYQSRYVVCASAPFLRANGIPGEPRELPPSLCMGLVPTPSGVPRPWIFRRGAEEVRVLPEGRMSFNASDALLGAASRGAGYVYVLEILARERLATGELVHVLPEWETASRTFYVVYPKSRFIPPKVRAFADFVAARLCASSAPAMKPVRVRRGGRS